MPENDHTSDKFGPRFEQAFTLANRLHAGQTRKSTSIPYISHLLGVAALVITDGGSEEEAVAALLHDAAEDQGGEATLALIEEQFGARVARIVADSSDTFEDPKPPWRERKESHLARMQHVEADTCRVMLADKVYNSRTLLNDLYREGEAAWDKFNGGKEGTLWYYREMHALLSAKLPGELANQLSRIITEIEGIASREKD
jgi:(p)ppGpp synthase/HD superfamily hydrolase